jgi:hypothetical protein
MCLLRKNANLNCLYYYIIIFFIGLLCVVTKYQIVGNRRITGLADLLRGLRDACCIILYCIIHVIIVILLYYYALVATKQFKRVFNLFIKHRLTAGAPTTTGMH